MKKILHILTLILMLPIMPIIGIGGLVELREKIAAKSKVLHDVFEEAGPDRDFSKIKSLAGDTQAKLDAINTMTAELEEIHKDYEKAQGLEIVAKRAGDLNAEFNQPAASMTFPAKGEPQAEAKSLGQLFVESKAYKSKGQLDIVDIDFKTLMSEGTAGFPTLAPRISRVELIAQRELIVSDIFPIIPTSENSIKYMYESAYASNAAEVKESYQDNLQARGEAQLAYTETSEPVQKIAVWLPVSDEQLEDVVGIQAMLNNRMRYMIEARLDGQLITGNASDPNIRGVLFAGSIQTQAKDSDPVPDAVFKAITLVRTVGFTEPDVIVMNPADWQDIRLLTTADGIYLFGSPMDAGPARLWGKPVVLTAAITEGTAVVGNFAGYAALYMKRGIEFKVTDSHASYFIQGVQAIRADLRAAAVYFRGTAFCKITGI